MNELSSLHRRFAPVPLKSCRKRAGYSLPRREKRGTLLSSFCVSCGKLTIGPVARRAVSSYRQGRECQTSFRRRFSLPVCAGGLAANLLAFPRWDHPDSCEPLAHFQCALIRCALRAPAGFVSSCRPRELASQERNSSTSTPSMLAGCRSPVKSDEGMHPST
jgi:hypothetical protein